MTDRPQRIRTNGADIPPPRRDRPPLRNNIFDAMQKGNTALMPLFPHLYPGAMVPAGAVFRGGPDKEYGHFFHRNTVDEVVVTFGANGALLKTGQVFVGTQVHGVDCFLKNEKDPESFAIFCITQRQCEAGPQSEAVSVVCKNCREEVYRFDFDATPVPDGSERDIPFPSVVVSAEGFFPFNADAALRTCKACGHVNPPFPIEAWGWDRYREQALTVIDGRKTFGETATADLRPAGAE